MFWRGDHLPPIMRVPHRLAWLTAGIAVAIGAVLVVAWIAALFGIVAPSTLRPYTVTAFGVAASIGALAGANVLASRCRVRRRVIEGDYAVCGECGHIIAVARAERCAECGCLVARDRLRSFWMRFFPSLSGIGPPRATLARARGEWFIPWRYLFIGVALYAAFDFGGGRILASPLKILGDTVLIGTMAVFGALLVRRARCAILARHVRLSDSRVCGDCATQITAGTSRCTFCGREWDMPKLVAQWDLDCPAHWRWEMEPLPKPPA
jgi:hypothetical protein